MKTLTTRELNQRTARILDAVEQGATFELRRNGKAIGYLTRTPPAPERKPDWAAHFAWLRRQPRARGATLLQEFEEDRRRLRARERALGGQP
ncbi:MAG: hypothetical protein KIT22_02775 [Verrucomicrobiae bacterium]|nr:hypothetical protein [Verrucomicrobiae bacterium]